MRKPKNFDVAILGSGSTAAAATAVARDLNKTVLLTEERLLGGTCLNYGCIPSKFLIEAAKTYFTMRRPRFDGIHCKDATLSFENLIQQKDAIIRDYRRKKRDTVFDDDSTFLARGHAQFLDHHTIDVDGKRYTAEKFLIATGSRPHVPEIEGLSPSKFLTSDLLTCDESEELKTLPESMVILGTGYIALELGQTFARFGTKVTIIGRGERLLSHGYEPEAGDILQTVLEDEGITVLVNSNVKSVSGSRKTGFTVNLVRQGKKVSLKTAEILVATGRQPNAGGIAADAAGVELADKGYVKVDEYLRTSAVHIFAAGDVIGPEHGNQMATPVGVIDAKLAMHNAFSEVGAQAVDHKYIPRCIFSDPEVAVVGLTEAQAKEAGHSYEVRSMPLSNVSRAVLMQHTDGNIKIISNSTNQEILGATIVAPGAGDIIHVVSMAMRMNAQLSDLAEMLYVYPSISEGVKYAARSDADSEHVVE
ncbi:MAG: NAD(P)/FAD-dependent oxidoreductase [Candidatus Melainabacteria bacterium]|nr:NAD(P)/FAD-dependent oxidoreductase [Candidatus Melainabacteria bacterium]